MNCEMFSLVTRQLTPNGIVEHPSYNILNVKKDNLNIFGSNCDHQIFSKNVWLYVLFIVSCQNIIKPWIICLGVFSN